MSQVDDSFSTLRAANARFVPFSDFIWTYNNMGQGLFQRRTPDGYPDRKEAWTGTMPMLHRWRLCNWLSNRAISEEGTLWPAP